MILLTFIFLIILHICILAALSKNWVSRNPDDVRFYLYWNSANLLDADELIHLNRGSIQSSHYDASKGLKMYSSGFLQNRTSDQAIKNAYLEKGFTNSHNIIVVDWGPLSGNLVQRMNLPFSQLALPPLYIKVIRNIEVVPKRIYEFLTFLYTNDASLRAGASNIHLVGQSLGAHIMGIVGQHFYKNLGVKIGRITGTDPAGPLFQVFPKYKRLDSSDATFVDVLHTNQGGAGYIGGLGHADTFVNGDTLFQVQPPCKPVLLQEPFCSHNVAVRYYAKSIKEGNIYVTNCNTNRIFLALMCHLLGVAEFFRFGESMANSARGSYYINNLTPN